LSYDSEQVLWQRSFQQVIAVQSAPAGLAVLATDQQDGQCSLYLLQADGKTKSNQMIGEGITNFALRGNLALMSCGTRVIVTDLASGKLVLDQEAAAEVIRVGFASDKSLTIVTRSGVQRLNFS
jgi:hypothetical protein